MLGSLQLLSEQVHLFWFNFLSVILDPLFLLPWIMLCVFIFMLLMMLNVTCHMFVKMPL